MMVAVRWAWIFTGVALLAACSRSSGTTDAPSALSSSPVDKAKTTLLVPPSDAQNVSAWEAFMHRVVQSRIQNANIHPYSYLVPGGSDRSDVQRRDEEAIAIRAAVKNSSVPGDVIVVAGPDSKKTVQVLISAFKKMPEGAVQGLKVMYIGTAAEAAPARQAVEASGAKFELMAMGAPQT